MWILYNRTQKLGRKPSAEVGINSPWLAWQFDECIYIFGLQVDAELSKCKHEADRSIKLNEMLGIERPAKKLNLAARMAMGGVNVM